MKNVDFVKSLKAVLIQPIVKKNGIFPQIGEQGVYFRLVDGNKLIWRNK